MRMIGVTGTQGKTTTTRLAESGLERAGIRAAVIGTVGTRVAGDDVKTSLTTPEAPDLHGLFAMMRERDVEVCAMEVSSHALVMGRVDGVVFDVAVFLNLGRDHLDFHARRRGLLRRQGVAVHPRARPARPGQRRRRARPAAAASAPRSRCAPSPPSGADADWRASDVELTRRGLDVRHHDARR